MLEEVQRSLGRIEGQLECVLEGMQQSKVELDKLDTRTRSLEGDRMKMLGFTSGLSTAVSALITFLFKGG